MGPKILYLEDVTIKCQTKILVIHDDEGICSEVRDILEDMKCPARLYSTLSNLSQQSELDLPALILFESSELLENCEKTLDYFLENV